MRHDHDGTASPAAAATSAASSASQPDGSVVDRDLVCGMRVKAATVRHRHTVDGTTYLFCSAGCREDFATNPERYLAAARPGDGGVTTVPASQGSTAATAGDDHGDIVTLDPVCGMTVDPATATHRHQHAGRTYLFCCAACRERFAADPVRYLDPTALAAAEREAAERAAAAPAGTIWTCPMDPEVRQDHPGPCPKCGMALEPLGLPVRDGEDPELVAMRRRFWLSLPLTLAVLLLAMGPMLPGDPLGGLFELLGKLLPHRH